ncbi:MAG: ABC transporter ATP-binding protein [Candidatus Hydrothermales bacterium]
MYNLKRFIKFILKFKSYIIFAFIFMSLSVLLSLPMPLLSKYLIDKILPSKDIKMLNLIGLFLIFVVLFQAISSYLQRFFTVSFRAKVIFNFKKILFEHTQNLDLEFFREKESGYLSSRISSDVDSLRNLLADTILSVIRDILTFLVGVILVLSLHFKLGIISISILPFYILSMIIFNKRIRSLSKELREYYANMQKDLQEALSGIDLIKAFTNEKLILKKVSDSIKKVIDKEVKLDLLSAFAGSIVSVIGAIAPLILIWYGIYEIIHERFTLGSLIAFNSFIKYLFGPAQNIVNTNFGIQSSLAALERVYEILDKKPKIIDGKKELKVNEGIIEFKNVCFSYNGTDYVLKNINLKIERGINAIVGPSGSGKSTMIKLMLRFYEPEEGEIFIDGVNIKNLKIESLRKNISLISQDIFLFSETILENLRFANFTATLDDIKLACKKARILDFIESLKDGFNTRIGERGLRLSGGERQRLSIARAILKDASILILDEATSELDSITEGAIKEFLLDNKDKKTIIVIAHRLSTINIADKVILLEDGKIIGEGNHRDLYEKYQIYKELCDTQFIKIN